MPRLPSFRLEKLPFGDEGRDNFAAIYQVIRKNFDALTRYFSDNGQLDEFRHVEFSLQAGDSQIKIKHGLGYVPKDVILSRLLAPSGAKLIVHHSLFDAETIVVSATGGAVKARMFVGTYRASESGPEAFSSTMVNQEFKAIL